MPHKRAKRAVREKQRTQSGLNLPPGARHAVDHEDIPKGAARVLNAAKVQEEFRQKNKRKLDEGDIDSHSRKRRKSEKDAVSESKKTIKIQPGESMAHFNRRVEDSMRTVVRSAMKNSSALARKKKEEGESLKSPKSTGKSTESTSHSTERGITHKDSNSAPISLTPKAKAITQAQKPKDFEHLSTSTPRRLNDIVQAPPELKKLPRGAKARTAKTTAPDGGTTLRQGALSMAQKATLEEERVRAVKMYREIKAARQVGNR